MSYQLVWENRGVIKRFSGDVTSTDLLQSGIDIQADERFDRLRYVVNDFTGISGLSFTATDIEEISAIDHAASHFNKQLRLAVITTHPDIIALATQYASSDFNIYPFRIFSDFQEGYAWATLPTPIKLSLM